MCDGRQANHVSNLCWRPGREFGVDVDFGLIQTTIQQKQTNDARQGRRKET
jgi:hypothetical protein